MLFPRSKRTTPISQVHGLLKSPEAGEDVFEIAAQMTLQWAEKRLKAPVPCHLSIAEMGRKSIFPEFTNPETNTHLRLALSSQIWGARLSMPGERGDVWSTDICLIKTPDTVSFGTKLFWTTAAENDQSPYISIPNITRQIAQDLILEDTGQRLGAAFTYVTTIESLLSLCALIKNPTRVRPVFVLTLKANQSHPEEAVLSPSLLAEKVGPLGHVFVVDNAHCYKLTKLLGPENTVYNGAVRSYLPGFGRDDDFSDRHRVATESSILNWLGGPKSFINRLFIIAAALSVDGEADDRVPSFNKVSQTVLELRAASVASPKVIAVSSSEEETLRQENRALREENARLREERDVMDRVAAEVGERNADLGRQVSLLKGELAELSHQRLMLLSRVESLSGQLFAEPSLIARWRQEGKNLTQGLPKDLTNVAAWADQNMPERLFVMGKAERGFGKSPYRDVPGVYHALLLLATEYRDVCNEGTSEQRVRFEERCKELGVSLTQTASGTGKGFLGDAAYVTYGGERRFLDKHLKKGTARDPTRTLRIYFFYDPETKRVIVGNGPEHLKCRIS